MREHPSHSKHYLLIVRSGILRNMSPSVNHMIHLPGEIHKVKHIFHVSDKLDLPSNFDVLRGMNGEVFEEFELRRFCDILYNPETKSHVL